MRFRHDFVLERPRCASAAFALIADHARLRERRPDAPPVRTIDDRAGGVGHTVELGTGADAVRCETRTLGPGLAVVHAYSNGVTMHWRVRDFQDQGAIVTLLAEVAGLEPGPEAERFRAGLLDDLERIKRVVEATAP